MSTIILDGKTLSKKIKENLKQKVKLLSPKPGLAVIVVGGNPASKIYAAGKEKACQEIGYYSKRIQLAASIKGEKLLKIIKSLNNDKKINGILVQFPLPKRLSSYEEKVYRLIDPKKDVDGLHPMNIGRLVSQKGQPPADLLTACTPTGIMRLLKESKIKIEGKRTVILGRSNLVGKPISWLLLGENATVTICHSKTNNIASICKSADILIAAIGQARFVKKSFVKKGAVVIDVGINRTDKGLAGDVDFQNVSKIALAISPVPGGVGPMTIAVLMENLLKAYNNQKKQ